MLTDNAIEILKERYLLRNAEGKIIESPEELFRRVSRHIASAEKKDRSLWEARFYNLLAGLEFLPNSPTLMNAGNPKGQLSACFVLPVDDSLESIFTSLKDAALIHQSGGGTGYNFSKLRPKGDWVTTSSGKASGPVAFMKVYDAATEHVKQGGKRRGANMGILNADHPDILDFITSKADDLSLQNFNISVGISNEFMKAVEEQLPWSLINPRDGSIAKKVEATEVWNAITEEAWKTGDPGLIFLSTINEQNPTPNLGTIESTNPCGEVPLLPYESCNLGSLNLVKMISSQNDNIRLDWTKLGDTVTMAVRFLDNVIDANHYILSQIKKMTTTNRKIGLGVMGWAELLMLLEIPYASKKAISLGERLMKFIKEKSYEASTALSKERGSFSSGQKRRNATCNSIAPTGTISVIANTSYSIEPLFALAYQRVGILGGKVQNEFNRVFVQKMKELKLWNKEIENEVRKTGSIQHIKTIPNDMKELFKTSLEIPWEYHLKHQLAFQKYTDNAVSKTINLPTSATIDEVSTIFWTAWKYKLKGITVYRYGSKSKQVLQKCNLNNTTDC
ncbi:adenosylcobalamin-dependent ribonucleoside-diphosphate reductase [Sungkyunkwania multivorans]|uniref:Vitamin B12-dependent ribonucleotide reductase n=1 Tax=Sungkyunkwania multivorans TaxID=1173618 RepID=A0ABW3D1S5_9FLAO